MATPKLFTFSVLAASAMAISAPAMAESKSKEVQYGDLDLSTASGQNRLKTRVKQAVKQVCGSPRAMTLKDHMDQNNCESNAIAEAMPKAERQIAIYAETRQLAARDGAALVGN